MALLCSAVGKQTSDTVRPAVSPSDELRIVEYVRVSALRDYEVRARSYVLAIREAFLGRPPLRDPPTIPHTILFSCAMPSSWLS